MQNVTLVPARQIPRELGGRLCLAFVNSVLWRRSGAGRDLLTDYAAFVRYLVGSGGLDPATADALLETSLPRPAESQAGFGRAIELREVLYRLFSAAASDEQPATADLDRLNTALTGGLGSLEVRSVPTGFALDWAPAQHELDWPLWEIAVSAAALLGSDDLAGLKQCPGPSCGWLFIDESRAGNRRWCSSQLCGNRDRVRRHY
ncbi:MAG TPA: ABATE domain-containing protein, partial [Actinomycetes bacterium]|nr:ABATE domain-containing protein [Actinomycetes bacterium]